MNAPAIASPLGPAGDARAPQAAPTPDAIKKVASAFESMVLGELLQPMFDSLDSDGLFGGGSAERMFRPMLVEQYAKKLSEAGGVGLSAAVASEMLRIQAGGSPPAGGS
jgi:Rod binding domain-containing protein